MNIRIGNGYDIHRLVTGRPLILGGVEIAHTMAAGTATISYNGPAAAAAGDNYVTFTQDILTDEQMEVPAYEIMGMNGYYG
ncbi:MAG: 2-C-methyl-D-erythritol 2,4-cyclodiphosphate synthase, partial [Microcystis aeruginosa]